MTPAPFAVDLGERAGKSWVGGAATYLFEGMITGTTPWWHAVEFGAGAAVVSVVFSFASRLRKNPEGQRTASLTAGVAYDPVRAT